MCHKRIDLSAYDQSWFSRGRSAFIVVAWELIQFFLIRPSPNFLYGWRRFWYRVFGAHVGKGVKIRKTVECVYPWRLSIGSWSMVGDHATLYTLDTITIGDSAVVSQFAYLCTGTHDVCDPAFGLRTTPIKVGNGAWVCLGATLMPGVSVGEGAVVGARALVTHDVPPWKIAVGIPAAVTGSRSVGEPVSLEMSG